MTVWLSLAIRPSYIQMLGWSSGDGLGGWRPAAAPRCRTFAVWVWGSSTL